MFESITRQGAARIIVSMTVATVATTACTADPSGDPGTVASPASAEGQPDAEAIRPFTIEISDEVLTDLNDRLARTRLPDQIPGTAGQPHTIYPDTGFFLIEENPEVQAAKVGEDVVGALDKINHGRSSYPRRCVRCQSQAVRTMSCRSV